MIGRLHAKSHSVLQNRKVKLDLADHTFYHLAGRVRHPVKEFQIAVRLLLGFCAIPHHVGNELDCTVPEKEWLNV